MALSCAVLGAGGPPLAAVAGLGLDFSQAGNSMYLAVAL